VVGADTRFGNVLKTEAIIFLEHKRFHRRK
jgi:hypothetical protein